MQRRLNCVYIPMYFSVEYLLQLHDDGYSSDSDEFLLGRFIQSYGTHIIVGMAVGGQDLVCVRQKSSSPIPPADLRRHLEDLGDFLFSDSRSPSLMQRKTGDGKHKVLLHFFFFLFLYFFWG